MGISLCSLARLLAHSATPYRISVEAGEYLCDAGEAHEQEQD